MRIFRKRDLDFGKQKCFNSYTFNELPRRLFLTVCLLSFIIKFKISYMAFNVQLKL